MLLALSLRDFVIVDEMTLSFDEGFTVLTGETGAGKSVTLDALGLLLGGKADYGQIRHGAQEAVLSALFDVGSLPHVCDYLREQGLAEAGENELALRRVIDVKGKSRNFINNHAVTLAQLKQTGSLLIDIYGQNAHHALNGVGAQRSLLDDFAGAQAEVADTAARYRDWQQAQAELQAALADAQTLQIERERLQWQFDELERLAPAPGEWQALGESYDNLAHAAELLQAAEAVTEITDGDDGLQSLVHRCRQVLQPLVRVSASFGDTMTLLDSVEAELAEVSANMRDVSARTETDDRALAAQASRMQELMSVARKYGVEPEALPERFEEAVRALAASDAAADTEALQLKADKSAKAYDLAAAALSRKRSAAAKKLSAEVTAQMQHLAMKGARFEVVLQPCTPGMHGAEQPEYRVAANEGQPLRNMAKVASGGELARIGLALQMVTGQYNHIPTLIFDEVDAGIGGAVAEVVGRALHALAQRRQVLAVTHLPQVAACGDTHWQVKKYTEKGYTLSTVSVLQRSGRIDELARMLGGETITDTTRRHAEEMLDTAAGR